ncbi:MAG: right-handed parallel beta-helix repeat-containing protein [Anaerolineales bacterium]
MKIKNSFKRKMISFAFAFLISAVWTIPAFADDAPPPPSGDLIEVTTSTDVDLPLSTGIDTAVSEEESAPAYLPEDVETVGQVSALTNQDEGSDSAKDPMWCPAGVAPKAGVGGCSISFSTLADLVNDIYADGYDPVGNGVVWLEQGNDNSLFTTILIDGSNPNLAGVLNFSLTLKGGWVYNIVGNTTINQDNPTVLSVPLVIAGWKGNVTLSDIVISAQTMPVGNDSGLSIVTTKNIQLDRVVIKDNQNTNAGFYRSGAYLDNSSGTGNIIINGSSFTGNEAGGLQVYSKGSITISDIVASHNTSSGVSLNNPLSTGGMPITIKGFQQFNNNTSYGLGIMSTGIVTISNISANSNGSDGVNINNLASSLKAGVTLNGVNYFNANGNSGLVVLSAGVITTNNLNANNNAVDGVFLDNCSYNSFNHWCDVTTSKSISIKGSNTFSGNGGSGLYVSSFGAVTLSNLISNYNFAAINVENNYGNLNSINNTGGVTLTGYGKFTGNAHGVSFSSFGNVALANIALTLTSQEGGLGISAVKPGVGSANVTISGTNLVSSNLFGLDVISDGKVTINNMSVIGNNAGGYIDNTNGLGVTLTGNNNFSSNTGSNGLGIDSSGPVTISNINVSGNGDGGLFIDNQADPAKPMAVTLSGNNIFNLNATGDGLNILSYGVVTLNNITAIGNQSGSGLVVDNCDYNAVNCNNSTYASVNLLGYVDAFGNSGSGINILSNGSVTTNTVSANANGSYGLLVQNQFNNLKPMSITLNGFNSFSNNAATGLALYTYGAITASNVTADYNGQNGAILDNRLSGTYVTPKVITLSGVNSFSHNAYDGLQFQASGGFVATHLNLIGNDGLSNAYSGKGIIGYSNGNIILSCVLTIDNEHQGMAISTAKNITINGIYSNYNGAVDGITSVGVTKITKPCTLP